VQSNTSDLPEELCFGCLQVLRMFGGVGGGPNAARRAHSPASSPPSTTHHAHHPHTHLIHQNTQDDLIIRTVTMIRPPESSHGFGICVKGGNDTGRGFFFSAPCQQLYQPQSAFQISVNDVMKICG